MRVGIAGAYGKLGSVLADAFERQQDLDVVRFGSADDPSLLSGADVVLDVSTGEAATARLPWLAEHGVDVVVGATGLDEAAVQQAHREFDKAGARCLVVPNFAIGAVLLMRFAAQAAPYFEGVEIVELHHDRKRDAPSGTARLTAERIADARDKPWQSAPASGRGTNVAGVAVHSVRLPGFVAHEEVLFGSHGEVLTLRHDSSSRESFVEGALLAVRRVPRLPVGVTVGLEAVLD